MAILEFEHARNLVIETVAGGRVLPLLETVPLEDALGRILGSAVFADRDYPPMARSVRDGFALQASSLPGDFQIVGEVRAGGRFDGELGPAEAVEIMTGAPVPTGADQIVMVEHAHTDGGRMQTARPPAPGEFINPQGSEAAVGNVVIAAGCRLNYAHIAMLATVGIYKVPVYRKPRVAILATGDEIIEISQTPEPSQIRNSNSYSIAAQVSRAGGIAEILPVAKDDMAETRRLILRGLEADMLLLSGGVSAGKYDFVEPVLAELGARFYFDGVKIQPGKPLVFGTVQNRYFFGLPGNPASTMVTFELFARAALELLSGQNNLLLPLTEAPLTEAVQHKTGLTRFLPARIAAHGESVTPVPWQGSSDIGALVRANCFMVFDSNRESWQPGDRIRILLQ